MKIDLTAGECAALKYILEMLLRGGNVTLVTRHKDFASLCRKVLTPETPERGGQ